MGVFYTTREAVRLATGSKSTAYNDASIDRAIDSASRSIEGMTHRRFYPEIKTVQFDWPRPDYSRPWRLWLDAHEMIEATAVTIDNGITTVSVDDWFLRRSDELPEPPYDQLQMDLSASAAFSSSTTPQKAVSVTGTYGHREDETLSGTLTAAISTTTAATCGISSSADIGVGSILRVGTERMIVTRRSLTSSTQTLQADLTARESDQLVQVTDGTGFTPGETITLDAERMRVADIAGNNLIVQRAYDGSTLAAHTGSTIYVPRALTVARGVLGTTAATHLDDADVYVFRFPALIESLAVAETIAQGQQDGAGWARTIGSDENQTELRGIGLADLRRRTMSAYLRMRSGAV